MAKWTARPSFLFFKALTQDFKNLTGIVDAILADIPVPRSKQPLDINLRERARLLIFWEVHLRDRNLGQGSRER